MKKSMRFTLIGVIILGISISMTQGATNPFSWIYKKIKSCTKVVPLATKATLQKASYEVKTFLAMADKLEKLDPRLVGLAAAEKSAQAGLTIAQGALEAAKGSLFAAQKSAQTISTMGQALATFSGKAFNVKKAVFEGYAIDFTTSPKVKMEFDAVVAGRPVTLNEVEFDLLFPAQTIKNILTPIVKKLWDKI